MNPLTYKDYLRLDGLLALQHPQVSPPHLDEMQFIIVHQSFELWFKLALNELDEAGKAMGLDEPRAAARLLRRVVQIERLWIEQIHVLETMSPTDFLRFRSILTPASGFQSLQFREIEFVSGLKDARFLQLHAGDPAASARLKTRMEAPSLWDAFLGTLSRAGLDAGAGRMDSLKALYTDPARDALRDLAEALIEHDEGLALWRAHHMHVVARMIGGKPGTGYALVSKTLKGGEPMGSQGVDYLVSTLSKKCFPELWEVRTVMEGP